MTLPGRLIVHLLAFLALGAAQAAAQEGAGALRKVRLRLPYTHQFQFAGVYAAQANGHFRAQGLEVEVTTSRDQTTTPVEEVTSGRAEFGILQGPQLVAARLAGEPVVVLAAIMQHSPLVLLVRTDSGIHTPHDLAGKRVALDRTALVSEIRMMLEREGIGFDKIAVVPNEWHKNELLTGEADAVSSFVIDGPHRFRRSGLQVNIIRPADYGVDFYGDCLFASESLVQKDRRLAEAMRSALLAGWAEALRDPAAVIEWMLANLPDRPEYVDRAMLVNEAREVARLINADLVGLGHMNEGRWRAMAAALAGDGAPAEPARLDGFVFHLEQKASDYAKWVWWGLILALGVALLTLLANRRLHRLVEKRTKELLAKEEHYRLLFELSPVAMVEFDYRPLKEWFANLRAAGVKDLAEHFAAHPEARQEALERAPLHEVNSAAIRAVGARSREEMFARIGEIVTPVTIEARLNNMVRLWQGLDHAEGEITYRHLETGEVRFFYFCWRMPRDADGGPAFRRAQTVLLEVTERRAAEQALRESEARYRSLFENAAGGVYRSTADGRFIAVNPALARMMGFDTPEEMMAWYGGNLDTKIYSKPGRRAEFLAHLGDSDNLINFESEVRLRDGRTLWVSENVRGVRDASDALLYLEGFVSDITPRRQLEAEMQRASKLEAIGILAGGIAHDFNNILTVVLGNITLAEMDTESQGPAAALLREAKRATLRARDLTQQLLTFAKGGDPVRTAVDLAELLRESAGFALHGSKARAEYEIPADLWPADADKGQIGQVVQNLVINSVQAMPQGGTVCLRAVNVTLATGPGPGGLPAGRYVRIAVADTGTGIAPEHLGKIFDPYFTTKQQGSGLGLASVYSIVKKHHGHIEVDSQLGAGATFHLWLPAAKEQPAPAEVRPASGNPFPIRVLFMDDEPTIRHMAGLFFGRLGAEGEMAADGAEALAKYRAAKEGGRPFDVVIMDLTVPGGMGGREAMEKLRTYDPNVKAIVSSGYSRDPVLANYRLHGFRGILPKPYGLEQLRRALRDLCDGA